MGVRAPGVGSVCRQVGGRGWHESVGMGLRDTQSEQEAWEESNREVLGEASRKLSTELAAFYGAALLSLLRARLLLTECNKAGLWGLHPFGAF